MSTSNDDSDIQELVAKAAITDLLFNYAKSIRNGDVDAAIAMFTDDAVFEIRDAAPEEPDGYRVRQRLSGRTEILAYLQQGSLASVRIYPLIHNPIVEVTGTRASSNSMMTAWILPVGKQLIGEYHDQYRWNGAWLFSARTYTILGQIGSNQP